MTIDTEMTFAQARSRREEIIAESKRLQAEIDDPASDLTAEQSNRREERLDALLNEEEAIRKAYPHIGRQTAPDSVSNLNPGGARRERIANRMGTSFADFCAAEPDTLDDGGFNSFGEMLKSIRDQRQGKAFDERLDIKAAGQNTGSDPDGGFLVPDFFQRELIMSATDREPWLNLRRNFIVPSGHGGVIFPVLSDRDRSGEDVGGVELQRTSESGQISLSTAKFKARKSELYKAATRVRVSNELLSDTGIGTDEVVQAIFAEAVALRQALDFVSGAGVGEPLGILNAPATYEQAKESGQTADTIVSPNILKMWERLSTPARSRAIWLAHPSTFEQLATLSIAVGTGGATTMLMDLSSAAPQTLLGAPIHFTEAAPTLGNKGDISLLDPGKYLYAQRTIRVDMSSDFRFDYDEAEFRIVLRDDGGPLHNATRTDAQGFEHSEIVTLAERA